MSKSPRLLGGGRVGLVGLRPVPCPSRRRPGPSHRRQGREAPTGRGRPRLALTAHVHQGPPPPERHGRAATPRRRSTQGPADGGERDTGGDEERDHEDGDEEDGRPGGSQPGLERAAHDGSEVPAGVAQRARLVQRRIVPQLGQPADGEEAEHRPDGEAHRVGHPGPFFTGAGGGPGVGVAATEEEREACARDHDREQHAGPSGDQSEAGIHPVTHRAEPGPPEGEGEHDAEGDEADGPQVAGLHPPEGLSPSRRGARPPRRRRNGRRLLLGRGPRLCRRPGVRTRQSLTASPGHHSTAEVTV